MNCWWEKVTCFEAVNKILKKDGWNLTWSWKVALENANLVGGITRQGESLGYEKVENKCAELEETVLAREVRCWRTRGVMKRKHYRAFDICRQTSYEEYMKQHGFSFVNTLLPNWSSIFHKALHLSLRCLFLCILYVVCTTHDPPELKAHTLQELSFNDGKTIIIQSMIY